MLVSQKKIPVGSVLWQQKRGLTTYGVLSLKGATVRVRPVAVRRLTYQRIINYWVYKHAVVFQLLKKSDADKNVLKNYRSVSNLPFLSKLLEKVTETQLQPVTNCRYASQLIDSCTALRRHC